VTSAVHDKMADCCRTYVEFGVQDGTECTTRNLRENEGWTGLMMDGGNQNDTINLQKEFFTAENIADLFGKYSVARHFDHLTIDIDQNTFWVLHSVLIAGFRPRSITAEINRNLYLLDSFTVPYNPQKMWDYTNAFGASVGAFDKLFAAFGYQTIAVDQDQINIYAVDSAEIGAARLFSLEEVAAGVKRVLCTQLHPCPPEPTVYMEVPGNVSLARPREEWYASLPLWSLACSGKINGLPVLFTGMRMDTPEGATEEAILKLPPVPTVPLPKELSDATPCGTVSTINSVFAKFQAQEK
jgi:hypothetical protein